MNKIYSLVWNAARGQIEVTSELAHAKRGCSRRSAAAPIHRRGLAAGLVAAMATVGVGAALGFGVAPQAVAQTAVSGTANNPNGAQAGGCNTEFVDRGNPGNPPPAGSTYMAQGVCDTAVGDQAAAFGGSVALGDHAFANGADVSGGGAAIALGAYANADNNSAVAIGTSALASGNTAYALGRQSAATGNFSQAWGNVSYAQGDASIAMGDSAYAKGYRSIAIGSTDVHNAASDGVSSGAEWDAKTQTLASGSLAVAIGGGANATGDSSLAVGATAAATGANSVAIGTGADSSGKDSLVLGAAANDNGAGQATVLGQGASVAAGIAGSNVALGQGSTVTAAAVPVSGATIGGKTYSFAGANPIGVVSVGSAGNARQMTRVAAGQLGPSSTDAVNGSQLYATNQAVDAANKAAGEGFDLSANGGTGVNIKPGATVDVSPGASKNIVVTQNATNGNLTIDTSPNPTFTSVTTTGNLTVGGSQTVSGSSTIGGAQTVAGSLAANGGLSVGAGTTVDMGGNTVSNIAPGVAGTDAVDVNQLNAVSATADKGWNINSAVATGTTGVANGTGTVNVAPGDTAEIQAGNNVITTQNGAVVAIGVNPVLSGLTSIAFTGGGPALSKTGIDMGGTGITGLTAGAVSATSTDAVNGAQLYATNQDVSVNAAHIATNTTDIADNTSAIRKGMNFGANSDAATVGSPANVALGGTVNIVGNASPAPATAFSDTNVHTVTKAGGKDTPAAVEVQFSTTPSFASVTTGNTVVNTSGVTIAGGANPVSLTDAGLNNGGNTITNVAAGTAKSDAATVGQLQTAAAAATASVAAGTNVASIEATTNRNGSTTYTVNADGANVVAGPDIAVTKGKPDKDNVTSYTVGLSQAAQDSLGNAVEYDNSNHTSVTLGGAGAKAPVALTNVAAGDISSTSTDAVNGSQLYQVQQAANNADQGFNLAANGGTGVNIKPGATLDVSQGKSGNIEVTQDSKTGDLTIDTNPDLTATSVTTGNTVLNNAGVTVNGGANGPVSLTNTGLDNGGNVISNVAPGAVSSTSTEAVNGSQLYQVQQTANAGWDLTTDATGSGVANGSSVANVAPGKTATITAGNNIIATQNGTEVALGVNPVLTGLTSVGVTNGPTISGTGIDMGNTSITNLEAGTAPTDAATVGQVQSAVAGAETHYYSVDDAGTRGGNYANDGATGADALAAGVGAAAAGAGAAAVGQNANAGGPTSLALGAGATASHASDVALGAGSVTAAPVATTGTTINGVAYTFAGGNPASVVSVGSAGHARQVTNVAAGELTAASTDAVNGSQLYSTNAAVTAVQQQVESINKAGSGEFQTSTDSNGSPSPTGSNSVAGGANATASGSDSLAVGNSSTASGNQGTALGTGATASGTGSTAVGNGAQATADNAVAIGAGSVANAPNTVSVGSAGNERRITNVAAGTASTDAVNVGQLQAAQAGAVRYDRNPNGSPDYNSVTLNPSGTGPAVVHNVAPGVANTDAVNVGQLNEGLIADRRWTEGYVNHVSRTLSAGIASAIAAANIPQPYAPGQSALGVGVGGFRGQSGIAVGLSHITDNGRFILKVNAGDTSRGDATVGAGAAIVW